MSKRDTLLIYYAGSSNTEEAAWGKKNIKIVNNLGAILIHSKDKKLTLLNNLGKY